jgi:hypothetical protein
MSTIQDCAVTFLKEQKKLFDEDVVSTVEEAKEFLEDVCTQIFADISEVREFMEAEGFDVSELSDEELEEELEVFRNPSGDYFVVEA